MSHRSQAIFASKVGHYYGQGSLDGSKIITSVAQSIVYVPVGLGGRVALPARVYGPDGMPAGLGTPDGLPNGGIPDGLPAGLGDPDGLPLGGGAPDGLPVGFGAPDGLPVGFGVPDGLEDDITELPLVFAMMKAVSTPLEGKTVPTEALKWHTPLL